VRVSFGGSRKVMVGGGRFLGGGGVGGLGRVMVSDGQFWGAAEGGWGGRQRARDEKHLRLLSRGAEPPLLLAVHNSYQYKYIPMAALRLWPASVIFPQSFSCLQMIVIWSGLALGKFR